MQLTVGQAVEILVSEGWLQEPHPELAAACSATLRVSGPSNLKIEFPENLVLQAAFTQKGKYGLLSLVFVHCLYIRTNAA